MIAVRAPLRVVALGAMLLSGCADPPEGRFSCAVDEDCPDDWTCRTDPSEPSLRCWSTATPVDAGQGDGGMRDGGMRDAGQPGEDAGEDDGGEPQDDAGSDAGMIDDDAGALDGGPFDGGSFDAGPFDAGSNPCFPNPCMNGGTCAIVGDSAECACDPAFEGEFCQDVATDECLPVTGHVFHQRTDDANTFPFPGFHSFTVTVTGSGFIEELYLGVGSFSVGMSYTITLAVGTDRVVRYPNVPFDARTNRGSATDPSNPLRNTALGVLPQPFAIVDGDALTITIEGSGGDLHRFSDGGARAALLGEDVPCGLQMCADGVDTFTCTGSEDPCRINPCLSGGTCTNAAGTPTCSCARGFAGRYCQEVDECASATCFTGYTCTDGPNSYTCTCPTCTDGNECQLGEAIFYRRSQDASSQTFPGFYEFSVRVTMTGNLHRMHIGLGSFSSATTYELTLSTATASILYGALAFGPHNQYGYDVTNTEPRHNMAEVILPTPFPVAMNDILTVTLGGPAGGTMHRFNDDGSLRMTLYGAPPLCLENFSCRDASNAYTCSR
jgi:hypothetical protein